MRVMTATPTRCYSLKATAGECGRHKGHFHGDHMYGTYLQVDEQDQLERGKRLGVVGRLEENQTKCGPKYSKFSTKATKKLD